MPSFDQPLHIYIHTYIHAYTHAHTHKAVNASLSESYIKLFATIWGKFLNRTHPIALTASEVGVVWANLTRNATGSSALRPQSAGDCEAHERCVGVGVVRAENQNASGWTKGDCVCYH